VAPRTVTIETPTSSRSTRARDVDISSRSSGPSAADKAIADAGDLQNLAVMMIAGVFVLIMSALSGWMVPSLVGGVIAFNMHQGVMRKKSSPVHTMLSRVNLGIFGFSFFLAMIN
jgi:hypothetical protein